MTMLSAMLSTMPSTMLSRKLGIALLSAIALVPVGSAYAAVTPVEVVEVHDAEELTAALEAVKAGDTIQLADGTYDGQFVATASGSADAPITVTGARDAILDGGGEKGYGFHLDGASYWRLEGFTITASGKGIIGDGANNNVVDGLAVNHTGDEAIHFRCGSSDNVVQNNEITDTGVEQPQYGEGIYFGSAKSNWDKCGSSDPDKSDRNQAIGNRIGPDVRAEALDLKEGTTGGEVRDNTFDGRGMSGQNYADSWVDAKGNDYVIAGNQGSSALLDGFQTHQILDGWGEGNVFAGNTADVGADGYGFNVQKDGDDVLGNVVCANNTVTNAGQGASNIPLTADCPVDVGDVGDVD